MGAHVGSYEQEAVSTIPWKTETFKFSGIELKIGTSFH